MTAKFLERKTLGFFVKTGGIFSKPFYSGVGHILVFHRVHPPIDTFFRKGGMEIWPENLEKIIEFFLNNGYDTISMDEVHHRIQEKKKRKKFVAFTLDDGYADNHDIAWPIFKKYNVPFTVYIATDFPDRNAILWWYLLEDRLMNSSSLEFTWEGKNYTYTCSSAEEKEKTFFDIRNWILAVEKESLEPLLHAILNFDTSDKFHHVNKLALSWEQIIEMSKDALVTIGAHSVSHCNLKNLPEKEAFEEIVQSKKIIEEHIGIDVRHFAYPYGTPNEAGEREFQMSKSAGFKTATTLGPGNVFPGHIKFLERLPRIPISNQTDEVKLNYIINGIHHFGYNPFRKTSVG